MAPGSSRRVSYVIPPPPNPAPVLKLPPLGVPRNGRPEPLLQYARRPRNASEAPLPTTEESHASGSTRHRLGVTSLALDTSTQLAGSPSPEGILYTGGKDGMIIGWELGIKMKPRASRYGVPPDVAHIRRAGRWEMMTGWADSAIDEEDDDDPPPSAGDVLGDVKEAGGRRGSRTAHEQEIPYEDRWETDLSMFEYGKASHFRQSTQAHTDWVNDIVLCNLNQTVVSASSDGTIKVWNPHVSPLSFPTTIGTHSDYVRCLALSRERQWIASGSFDRTIKLWDLSETRPDPLMTLQPPEPHSTKSSVYALATDPAGHVIASGSPERVVRTWDPRSGKRIGKLVGHTDNIRAILISEDSRYMLTGSADASVKIWSILSPQRCLHTFTHHTDSVWSLFSSHPNLETFYSADRSGLVCRVDVEACSDIGDGECVVVCKESDGVNKLVAMDDNLLWTATGSSSIKRWRAPSSRASRGTMTLESPLSSSSPATSPQRGTFPIDIPRTPTKLQPVDHPHPHRRTSRLSSADSISPSVISLGSSYPREVDSDSTLFGIPFVSLVRLASTNDPFPSLGSARSRDPEVATLYSAASVMSVPRQIHMKSSTPLQSTFPSSHPYSGSTLYRSDTLAPPDIIQPGNNARAMYEERDLAVDAQPLYEEPDVAIPGDHGLVRGTILNDRIHTLTVDTVGEVAVWDLIHAQCLGRYLRDDVAHAIQEGINASSSSVANSSGSGGHRDENMSPRQALEAVRERIEGEAVVLPWAQADTRIGELTIHLLDKCFEGEVFADEVGFAQDRHFTDESRLNLGKWVLRNLFLNFIREEQREAATRRSHDDGRSGSSHSSPPRSTSRNTPGPITLPHSRFNSEVVVGLRTPGISTVSPAMTPVILPDIHLGNSPKPTPRFINAPQSGSAPQSLIQETPLSPIPQSPTGAAFPTGHAAVPGSPTPRVQRGQLDASTTASQSQGQNNQNHNHSSPMNADYFSLRRRQSTSGTTTSAAGVSGQQQQPTTPDDFSGWSGPGSKNHHGSSNEPQTPSTPSGLMGRLKHFGKSTKRAASEADSGVNGAHAASTSGAASDPTTPPLPTTIIQRLKSQPLNPPTSSEAPNIPIPPGVSVVISEGSSSGWMALYRNLVVNVGQDVQLLEESMPDWLLEYLLMNKAPPVPVAKLSFVLLPVPLREDQDPREQLPELLNSAQSKLSASRFLRVRKLTHHVQEKVDRISATASAATTPRTSTDTPTPSGTYTSGTSSPTSLRLNSQSYTHSHSHPHYSTDPRIAPATTRPRAEDLYEILCNDYVLPLDMTLAAVRQYVWRNAAELTMYYRRRQRPVSPSRTRTRSTSSPSVKARV